MSNFLVSRISPGGNIRLVLAHATAGEHQAWSLSERDARALRDALTLALGAGLPRTGPATGPSLGCRITGRGKPCRGCGAESGHAHAATCSLAVYAGPERRAGSRTPGENDEVLTYTIRGALEGGRTRTTRGPIDPPTPEEKAAGERIRSSVERAGGMFRENCGPARGGPDIVGYGPNGYVEFDVGEREFSGADLAQASFPPSPGLVNSFPEPQPPNPDEDESWAEGFTPDWFAKSR